MIKNLLSDDEPEVESKKSPARSSTSVLSLFDSAETDDRDAEHDQTVIIPSEPETMAETVRRTGLAWSAGIAFFAAVVFMIILGWGADVLLGTSPWGIVGGIVLGSVIGFIQFFRITSQIFKK
jgi:F0F1-type ATP synthase assembly protein I